MPTGERQGASGGSQFIGHDAFDIPHGMVGQRLRYLSHDARGDLLVQPVADFVLDFLKRRMCVIAGKKS